MPLTVTSFSAGVLVESLLFRTARYCTKREVPGMSPPLDPIGAKSLQLPSGVGVFPVRTLIARSVPDGVAELQVSAPQLTLWPAPASKTRESNVLEAG